MTKSWITIFILLISFNSFASEASQTQLTTIDQLPQRLVKLHASAIEEAQCTDLADQLATNPVSVLKIDDYTRLYVVPCALWSRNQSWKVYAEFNEPKEDGNGLFRRMLFSTLEWTGQLKGSDLISTWRWNDETQALQSVFLYNGRQDCGSLYSYTWDSGRLEFILASARMKVKCDGDTSWPEISLPKLP